MSANLDIGYLPKCDNLENHSLLRHFAIKILSLDTSKELTRKKRKRAARDENYLLNRLVTIV